MIHPKLVPSLLLVGALAFGVATTPAKAQVNLGSGIVINDIDVTGVAIDPVTGIMQFSRARYPRCVPGPRVVRHRAATGSRPNPWPFVLAQWRRRGGRQYDEIRSAGVL